MTATIRPFSTGLDPCKNGETRNATTAMGSEPFSDSLMAEPKEDTHALGAVVCVLGLRGDVPARRACIRGDIPHIILTERSRCVEPHEMSFPTPVPDHQAFAFPFALVALVAVSACTVPSDLIEEQSCPCIAGWVCDLSGTCMALPVLPSTPPNVPTDCWRNTTARCDWSDTESFEFVPENIAITALSIENDPVFSPDGCSLYFASNGQQQIAHRRTATSPFETAETVVVASIEVVESNASVTPDGLQLFFSRRETGQATVWRATRSERGGAWGNAMPAPGLDVMGESNWDGILAPHGLRFYWAPSGDSQDLWTAERASLELPFTHGRPLDEFASDSIEAEPSVTADGRVILWVAGSPTRLLFAERNDWRDTFEPSQAVPGDAIENATRAQESTVSADGCEILVKLDGVMTRLVHLTR